MSLRQRSSVVNFLLILLPLTWAAAAEAEAEHFSSSSSCDDDLHKVLQNHGLPAGLFPQGVKYYNLDQKGYLEVHLDKPCLAQYETRVFFDSVVRANLSFGQLKVLEGMSRQELFLWLPVKHIIVRDPSSGRILIDIGFAFKHLSFSRFEDSPVCRSKPGLSLKVGGRKGVGLKDQ